MKNLLLLLAMLFALPVLSQESAVYPFREDGKYGYKDSKGNILFPARLDHAGYFSNSPLAAVKENGKYGYIDKSGKIAIALQYDLALDFHNGYAVVEKGGLRGLIDITGKEIIPITMRQVDSQPSASMIRIKSDDKVGYFNTELKKEVVPLRYEDGDFFYENRCAVKKNGKWGFIDKKGTEVIAFNYDGADFFVESRAAVKSGTYWGFIDVSGKMVIEAKYDSVGYFYKGGTFVKQADKWGVIGKSGKQIIPFKYDAVSIEDLYMIDPLARLRAYINREMYLVDVTGIEIPVKGLDNVRLEESYVNTHLIGEKNGKAALLDKDGKQLTQPIYENIEFVPDALTNPYFIIATVDGKKGVLDKNGVPVTAFIYDNAEAPDYYDLWLIKDNVSYRANVEGCKINAPRGMESVSEILFADAAEVSVGDYAAFLTSRRGSEDYEKLLPDTNAMPAKLRPAFKVFFIEEEPMVIDFKSPLFTKAIDVSIPRGADKRKMESTFLFPVTGITYEQANAYCAWRSEQSNETYESSDVGVGITFRLPSPREWEAMAKGGLPKGAAALDSLNKEGCMLYNFKTTTKCKTSDDMAAKRGPGLVHTNDFWPSLLGISTIFGNAAEMTSIVGVAKGGSYMHFAKQCYPAEIQEYYGTQPWLGFRCVAEFRR